MFVTAHIKRAKLDSLALCCFKLGLTVYGGKLTHVFTSSQFLRERCRADTLLIGVKPADESDFSANTDAAALTSQLDVLQARGGEWPSD